jgi:shikimate kinase
MAKGNLPIKAIFLVGFMGSGKTSVGRALAELLGWDFVDLDDRIVAREGHSVGEIFAQSGESTFRRAEAVALREIIAHLNQRDGVIVALGGGAFVQADNSDLLAKAGQPVIFLDAPVEELWRRCEENVERPLRRDRQQFRALYETRRPHYLKASVYMDTHQQRVETIAANIASHLGLTPTNVRQER